MHPATKVRRTTEHFRAADLYVDPQVQRTLRPAHLRKLIETLDLDAIGTITVNLRSDGIKSIVDGQHRREALIEHGFGDWKLRCDTYHGLSIEDEHRFWRLLNDSKPATAWEDFHAALGYGDETSVEIKNICGRHGFKVTQKKGDGSCCAIAALRKVHAAGALDETMRVIAGAWGDQADAASAHIVNGIGLVLSTYNGEIDRQAFVGKVGKKTPTAIVASARQFQEWNGGSIARGVANIAIDLYNRGRRSGQVAAI